MNIEKRGLQAVVAVGGLVPVLAGGAGVLMATGMIPHAVGEPSLDSHYRYLSGLLLAIGLGFWSCVPHIERRSERMRLLTAIVVAGGLARAYGLVDGTPGMSMRLALVMELMVTPLICLWQARVARRAAPAPRERFRIPVVPGRAAAPRTDPGPAR